MREEGFSTDPNEKRLAIQAITDFLVTRPENEVDAILRASRGGAVTPAGWGHKDVTLRRLAIAKLLQDFSDAAIESLMSGIPPDTAMGPGEQPHRTEAARRIFLVHGHALAELHETVRVLERMTGLEVTVLREQPNAGRTILEKFEDHAANVSYAVVLLTPDDSGGARSGEKVMRPRGRQNVVFELGFFFGKLGRDRVAVLLGEGVEKPSDIESLIYITMDKSGAWKLELARELRAAGIPVDYSRIPSLGSMKVAASAAVGHPRRTPRPFPATAPVWRAAPTSALPGVGCDGSAEIITTGSTFRGTCRYPPYGRVDESVTGWEGR
jgi:predicted nucleotide-binding protein